MPATASKPEAGDYLENGKRLVEVKGYTKAGSLRVEDVATETIDTLTIAASKDWRPVKRRKPSA